ncbi:hypothetical protein FRB97_004132, partial [Tulasnella sp. 331]
MVTVLYERLAEAAHRVCLTVRGVVVAPATAIFATSTSLLVRTILEALQLPDLVFPLPFGVAMMASREGLRTDDAWTVAKLIRSNSVAIKRLFRESLQTSRCQHNSGKSVSLGLRC